MNDPLGAFEKVRDNFLLYVKTAFATQFSSIEHDRHQLLMSPGGFHKEPWIEPLPRFLTVKPAAMIDKNDVPGLDDNSLKDFITLVDCGLVGKFPLYSHQLQMLRTVMSDTNAVVTAGTGSGKTEAFLLPLFAYLNTIFKLRLRRCEEMISSPIPADRIRMKKFRVETICCNELKFWTPELMNSGGNDCKAVMRRNTSMNASNSLPKRTVLPATTEGEAYDRFLLDVKKRLSRHPRLRGLALNSTADIDTALQTLDKHADGVVTSTASAVFLSTAVLQSGRLDVLVVFAAQTKLIWQVAHVYYQRPSLRDFVQLYANVASTAFIAAGIEDIDVDVLVGTIFGSTVAAIPGMHLLASSVLSGSANAFLTLRVGMITKEYCRCTVRIEKTGLRRAATLKAAKLLGSIVREGTVKLSKATVNATKTKMSQAFDRVIRRRGTVETL